MGFWAKAWWTVAVVLGGALLLGSAPLALLGLALTFWVALANMIYTIITLGDPPGPVV